MKSKHSAANAAQPSNSSTTPNPNCFARNHQTPRQYGLYTTVRERQGKLGFVFFDGDDLADCFLDTSRDVIYRDAKALINTGWLEVQSERKRKKDGTWEARRITALSHKEWCGKHDHTSWANSQNPQGSQSHQCNRSSSCSSATDQSHVSDSPIAPVQPSSRTCATDQSLHSDKDKVLIPDRVLHPDKDHIPDKVQEQIEESFDSRSRLSNDNSSTTGVSASTFSDFGPTVVANIKWQPKYRCVSCNIGLDKWWNEDRLCSKCLKHKREQSELAAVGEGL